MKRRATFSRCRRYRYSLWRHWGEDRPGGSGFVLFVGLNPSTADERQDDPTLRRCIGFAQAWGFEGLIMANLFAWRATDPRALKQVDDPVGPRNDATLRRLAQRADLIVAAWGNPGSMLGRDQAVRALLGPTQMLRLTRQGQPSHPLYLPRGLTPQVMPGSD